jgi:hypothetical protein
VAEQLKDVASCDGNRRVDQPFEIDPRESQREGTS